MEKCRICLENRTKTVSIHERIQYYSYADIITSVANVKIWKDDITEKICRACCKRLKEVYEFKLLIERSDAILNQISDSKLKRISFNNLAEIGIDFKHIKQEHTINENVQEIVTNLENGVNICVYNNIIIKKVDSSHEGEFKIPMSIAEFLSNYNKEVEYDANDFFYEIYDDDEADYDNDDTFSDNDFNIQDYKDDTEDISVVRRTRSGNTYATKVNKNKAQYENDDNLNDVDDTEDIPLALRTRSGNTHRTKIKKSTRKPVGKFNNQWKEYENDENYVPGKSKTQKCKMQKQNAVAGSKPKNVTFNSGITLMVRIRPKVRDDLRLIPAKPALPLMQRRKRRKKEKSEICPHCGKYCKHLSVHLLAHKEGQYICNECHKKFINKARLEKHMKTHSNIKPYKCDMCVAAFIDDRYLSIHKLCHRDKAERPQFTCEICKKIFTNKPHLRRHTRIHNSGVKKNVNCEVCSMSFYDNYGLKHHMRVHTGERPFRCEMTYFKNHIRMHNPLNKNVKCEQCNLTFFSKSAMNHHMRVHTGERPFKCELCSQPYSYKHDFNRHCFKKHGIFLKRRKVYIMNDEVLAREKQNMKELVLRANGLTTEGVPSNIFEGEGNFAWQAIEQAMRELKQKKIDFSDLI